MHAKQGVVDVIAESFISGLESAWPKTRLYRSNVLHVWCSLPNTHEDR